MAQGRRRVSREEFFRLIKQALIDVTEAGLSEDFLVEAMRNMIDRFVSELSDLGAGEKKREEIEDQLKDSAFRQDKIDSFRKALSANDPSAADLTDEEISSKLLEMATSNLLGPTSAGSALAVWKLQEGWARQRELFLSDDILRRWGILRAARAS